MKILVIGYINGNVHHAYVHPTYGRSEKLNIYLAARLFKEMTLIGHASHRVVLSETEYFEWVEC